jgi:hypothetical protein
VDPHGASDSDPGPANGWDLAPLRLDAAAPQVGAARARLQSEEPVAYELLIRDLPQLPSKLLRSAVSIGDVATAGIALILGVLALGAAASGGGIRAAVVGGLLVVAAVFLVVRALRERSRALAMEGSGAGSALERTALYEQLRGLATANGLDWQPISEPRHGGSLLMQAGSQTLCVLSGTRGASTFELGLLTGGAAGPGPHLYAVVTTSSRGFFGSRSARTPTPGALVDAVLPPALPVPARTEVAGDQAAALVDDVADPDRARTVVPALLQWIDATARGGTLR